jgi:small subunit ribosomal protein S15
VAKTKMCYKGNNVLTQKQKTKIIEDYKLHKGDTGSAEVQVALLTEEIKRLVRHLKNHAKDNHSRRGLLKMVSKRKNLLDYLKRESVKRYNSVAKKLGLKK